MSTWKSKINCTLLFYSLQYTFYMQEKNLLFKPELTGADFHRIERGGDITFHGPGQLVIYPIFDLETLNLGISEFVEKLEETVIHTLKESGLPVLSEEGKEIPFEVRKNWEYYWLVDPLDGTKEFIKRNGEFTVNIALMINNLPFTGVIFQPVNGLQLIAAPAKKIATDEVSHADSLAHMLSKL